MWQPAADTAVHCSVLRIQLQCHTSHYMTVSVIITAILSAGVTGVLFLIAFIIRRRTRAVTKENIVPHVEVVCNMPANDLEISLVWADSSRCNCSQDSLCGNCLSLRGDPWCCRG